MSAYRVDHRSENLAVRVVQVLIQNADATREDRAVAARLEGLPTLQASILIHINSSSEKESTVGELADVLHLTPPTISDSLKALVNKGFLRRRRSPRDGRIVIFSPTRKGSSTADRLTGWSEQIEDSIAGMDRKHQLGLMGALTRMMRNRVENGYRIAEPMCVSCGSLEVISWEDDLFRCSVRGSTFGCDSLAVNCARHVPWVKVN
jgi:DNA-binding MarR family transcriptional regulator